MAGTEGRDGARPGRRAYSFASVPRDVVVVGSEGRGIYPKVLALCGERVTIPQQGLTQSLNLAVTVGIVLFEDLRQGITPASRQDLLRPALRGEAGRR